MRGSPSSKGGRRSAPPSAEEFPFVTTRAGHVIDRLFEGAGSSAIADFNPMQRFWQDGHTVRLYTGSDYDQGLQHHGRNLLGLMPTPDL
ncbi:MAG TPA: hypothetical protein VGH03_19530 [Caulobacteraceae bacterium]|jgi:hypothetical protein